MAKGRADINLILGIRPEDSARRIAEEMSRGFKQAGTQAGLDYNQSFTAEIDKLNPKISRSVRNAASAILQVDEASSKAARSYFALQEAQERVRRDTEAVTEVMGDATATTGDLTKANERLAESTRDLRAAERARVNDLSAFSKANSSFARQMALVNKSIVDVDKDNSAGQTLLTIGKYISAIRAGLIPVIGSMAAIGSAGALSSLAALSQGLWMIPAGAGAATAAIGSLQIATMGFGDAIKDMGDPEKFFEALQNLSPNAQQAALAIQALTDPLKALKNNVQDALFADFAPMINQLTAQYLPMMNQLFGGIANAFNSAARGLFDSLMTSEMQSVLQNLTNNLVSAFERLAPAAAPFADAIMRIVETGSSFLPQIADSITEAARGFADFIREAQQSGKLEEWMRDGIKAVGQLWDGVKELGKAFAALAPAGQEVLPQIVEILKSMGAVLPPIIDLLADMLVPIGQIAEAFNNMWNAVGPIFTNLGKLIQWVDDKLGGLLNRFNNPFIRMALGIFGGGKLLPQQTALPPAAYFPGAHGLSGNLTVGGGSGIKGQTPGTFRRRDGSEGNLPSTQKALDAANAWINTGGTFSTTPSVAPVPAGGYPMPAPPPDKGSGGGSSSKKADEPPFTADPSTYSLDSIPIGSFFGDGSGTAVPAPMAAPVTPLDIPDLTRANRQIDLLTAIATAPPFNLSMASDVRNEPGSWHHVAQAGDFSNSSGPTAEMHAFAMYMAENFGGMIEELIYGDPVRGNVLIGGGRLVGPGTDQPNYYDSNTIAQHMNHVHIAVTDAMAPYLEAAMQGNMLGAFGAGGGLGSYGGYFSVDQEKIAKAEADREQAARTVEEKRLAYRKLEASGDADQLQLLRAKNDVIDAEENLRDRERAVAEARMGVYKEFDTKLQGTAKQVTTGMGQIGAALANDFGISEGLPGIAKWITTFLANLAFAPAMGALSAVSAAGQAASGTTGGSGLIGMFAPPVAPMDQSAMGPTPLGGGVGSPLLGGMPIMKFDSGGMLPPGGIGVNMTSQPEPVLTPEQWGQMQTATQGEKPPAGVPGQGTGPPPGPPAPGQSPNATGESTSQAMSVTGGPGFSGLGGLPMALANTAISAGSLAIDGMAPGAGQAAAAAANIGLQLANRAAGYAGQVAGIAVGGLMETFLPNNSALADPGKSWIGRIASGVSGARPAVPNAAGGAAPAKPPAAPQGAQQGAQQGGGGPMVLIENLVNQTPDAGQTIANQVARQAQTGYLSRMGAR